MVKPDPNFRPNPDRSILIHGLIDDAQVDRLAPLILKLRKDSNDPITVYINSNGGFTNCADTIFGLLKSKDLDRNSPRIITVAIGNAKSAAAFLLTYGDYAYAYKHASILFHGVRVSAAQNITVEDSYSLANSLGATNESVALRLAGASVRRLVLQFALARPNFATVRTNSANPNMTDIECFAAVLNQQLKTDWPKRAVRKSIERCLVNDRLSDFVFSKVNVEPNQSVSVYDCNILRTILDYELDQNKNTAWRLDETGLTRVVQDYMLLRDYYLGGHTSKLESITRRFAASFLTPEEMKIYEGIQQKPKDEILKWLSDRTALRVRPFWYLVVSLWRHLLQADNPIVPKDAYYLGAVDEVIGLGEPCSRLAVEDKPLNETLPPTDPPAAPGNASP